MVLLPPCNSFARAKSSAIKYRPFSGFRLRWSCASLPTSPKHSSPTWSLPSSSYAQEAVLGARKYLGVVHRFRAQRNIPEFLRESSETNTESFSYPPFCMCKGGMDPKLRPRLSIVRVALRLWPAQGESLRYCLSTWDSSGGPYSLGGSHRIC